MKKLIMSLGIMLVCLLALPASKADASARLNQSKATIYVGGSTSLRVRGTNGRVTWTTSNKRIATVRNGKVTARKAGTATITAKAGNRKMTCRVTVKNQYINNSYANLNVGKITKVRVNGAYGRVTYKTSNKKVAVVSKYGNVKAVGVGTATITARYNGKNYTCRVVVNDSHSEVVIFNINKKMMTAKMTQYLKQLDIKNYTSDNTDTYYTVTKVSYERLMKQIRQEIEKSLVENTIYGSYVKNVTVDSNCMGVNYYAKYDKADTDFFYEELYDRYAEAMDYVGEECAYYQAFHGISMDRMKLTIRVYDITTKKLIGSKTFSLD